MFLGQAGREETGGSSREPGDRVCEFVFLLVLEAGKACRGV